MEDSQRAVFRRNHVQLIQELEPRGGMLDSLYEDGVLTDNDCERIANEQTRKERCQLLLHMIPSRGPNAYGLFRKALIFSNYYILAEKLEYNIFQQYDECYFNLHGIVSDRAGNANGIVKASGTPDETKWCTNCADFIQKVLQTMCVENYGMKAAIETCGCLILDNVEPNDVIDRLYQDQAMETDEVDFVKSGVTRRQRCEIMFQQLISKPNRNMLDNIISSLCKKYYYIAELLLRDRAKMELKDPKRWYTRPLYEHSSTTQVNCITELSINEDDSERDNKVVKQKATAMCTEDQLYEQEGSKDSTSGGHVAHNCLKQISKGKFEKISCSTTLVTNESNKDRKNICQEQKHEITASSSFRYDQIRLSKAMVAIPSETSHKKRCLTVAFNYLSDLINQGEFVQYKNVSTKLQRTYPAVHDLLCIIGYLNASRDLFRKDFDSAKRNIKVSLELVRKTSNPRYFTLELFTAKTRMYLPLRKLEKFQTTLDEAMMIIETDPKGCTGRAAGWLYLNDARFKTAQITCLNLSKSNAMKTYELLFASAKASFHISMNNFMLDGGNDGPFGFGYALCRLVILLLRCGENGMTMTTLKPPDDDINTARQYLQYLEDSAIFVPKILNMHFCLAKCDYQFRRNNYIRSLQHAQTAYDLVKELNMQEFTEHALNRLKFLRSLVSVNDGRHDISEEEVQEILFGQSYESGETSLSE